MTNLAPEQQGTRQDLQQPRGEVPPSPLNGNLGGHEVVRDARPWRQQPQQAQTPVQNTEEKPSGLLGFFNNLKDRVVGGFEAVHEFVSNSSETLVDLLKSAITSPFLNPIGFAIQNSEAILSGLKKSFDVIKDIVTHPAFIAGLSIALIAVGTVFPPAMIAGIAIGALQSAGDVIAAVASGDPMAIGLALGGLALCFIGGGAIKGALSASKEMLKAGAREATELAAKNIGKEAVEKLALNPQSVQKLGSEIGTDAALGVKELIRKTPELATNPAQLEAAVKASVSELTEKRVYAFLKEADTHKIVEQLTTEFLETFSRGGKESVEKLMSFGMTKEAAEEAAKELSQAIGTKGSRGAFDAELKDILEEHISKAIIDDLKKKGIQEAFEGSFSAQMQVVKNELAQEGIELSDDALKAIHKGAKEGFEEGLERGVRKIVREGIEEAFRKFRRPRDMPQNLANQERKKKESRLDVKDERDTRNSSPSFEAKVSVDAPLDEARRPKKQDPGVNVSIRQERADDLSGRRSFLVGKTSFYGEDEFDYTGGLRGGGLADALGIPEARKVDSSEIKITKEEEKV